MGFDAYGSPLRQRLLPVGTVLLVVVPLLLGQGSAGQAGIENPNSVSVDVVDDTGIPVFGARLVLVNNESGEPEVGETNYAGSYTFGVLREGSYALSVSRSGFYSNKISNLIVNGELELEVTLSHEREFNETVDVVYYAPEVDRTDTGSRRRLTGQEVVNLPFPATRDIRNALPLMQGVVKDARGTIHVAGAHPHQITNLLDGFDISRPFSGGLDARVSSDSIRSLEILTGRYPPEYGRSVGVVSLETGMGDDRFRFSATDFLPSIETKRGLHLDNWTPRITFSGPLKRGRAWFFNAWDGEYGVDVIEEQPPGRDRNRLFRFGHLAKGQLTLGESNTFTALYLFNRLNVDHFGLSPFTSQDATQRQDEKLQFVALRDKAYLGRGVMAEAGMAVYDSRSGSFPMEGVESPYVMQLEQRRGGYFRTSDLRARRFQWLGSILFPAVSAKGNHEIRVGADVAAVSLEWTVKRAPVSVLREDGTLSRRIVYKNAPEVVAKKRDVALFLQDRWFASDRLVLDLGTRLEGDTLIGEVNVAPRISCSYLLNPVTKVSGGVGLFFDSANLELVTLPRTGLREDFFYATDGLTLSGPPLRASFAMAEDGLKAPRSLNWSLSLQRKVSATVLLELDFQQRRGRHGWVFVPTAGPGEPGEGDFELTTAKRDRYDAFSVSVAKTVRDNYRFSVSYTRSAARSNHTLMFDLENPILATGWEGPFDWDTPHRLISSGWLPLSGGFDFAYSLELRNGYPFSVVSDRQALQGLPNGMRFPFYFCLNTHVEKRLRFFKSEWAFRVGFNNITNRRNPTYVNNNADSPSFLTFGALEDRALVGRLRFLGRK